MKCQSIKKNRMQCSNDAWISVNGILMCRLDFNWWISDKSEEAIRGASIALLDEKNRDKDFEEFWVILQFHLEHPQKQAIKLPDEDDKDA